MFTKEQAKEVGDKLKVDWDKFDLEQLRKGMVVELEHGTKNPKWNITNDCPIMTAKIALAHLEEIKDYYTRLDIMEKEGKNKEALRQENAISRFLKGL